MCCLFPVPANGSIKFSYSGKPGCQRYLVCRGVLSDFPTPKATLAASASPSKGHLEKKSLGSAGVCRAVNRLWRIADACKHYVALQPARANLFKTAASGNLAVLL